MYTVIRGTPLLCGVKWLAKAANLQYVLFVDIVLAIVRNSFYL